VQPANQGRILEAGPLGKLGSGHPVALKLGQDAAPPLLGDNALVLSSVTGTGGKGKAVESESFADVIALIYMIAMSYEKSGQRCHG